MFGLKLPSQIKAGAAEVVHGIKKANGEVDEYEATPQWRRSKGAPVWGPQKGGPASTNPASPSAAPADKPGWNDPQAPSHLSISDEVAKVRIIASLQPQAFACSDLLQCVLQTLARCA